MILANIYILKKIYIELKKNALIQLLSLYQSIPLLFLFIQTRNFLLLYIPLKILRYLQLYLLCQQHAQ